MDGAAWTGKSLGEAETTTLGPRIKNLAISSARHKFHLKDGSPLKRSPASSNPS